MLSDATRVQENTEETKTQNSANDININSNDQMLYDRSVIKVKGGEQVNLTLNHT